MFNEPPRRTQEKLHQQHNQIVQTTDKKTILKAAGKKRHSIYRGTKIRMTADFSSETMQVNSEATALRE